MFEFADEGIHITITARFENEDLIVEGYDIGKTVEAAWGDSDYEYITTIRGRNMKAFCKAPFDHRFDPWPGRGLKEAGVGGTEEI